jgi:hypothetical protein
MKMPSMLTVMRETSRTDGAHECVAGKTPPGATPLARLRTNWPTGRSAEIGEPWSEIVVRLIAGVVAPVLLVARRCAGLIGSHCDERICGSSSAAGKALQTRDRVGLTRTIWAFFKHAYTCVHCRMRRLANAPSLGKEVGIGRQKPNRWAHRVRSRGSRFGKWFRLAG